MSAVLGHREHLARGAINDIITMVFCLYRTRKPTAVTRCMCPLYDTNRQAWIELQPMSVGRVGHGVVAAGQ